MNSTARLSEPLQPSRSALPPRPLATACAVAGAAVVYFVTQVSIVAFRPGWSISDLRDFFSYDAFGYMAIVKNAADGQFAVGEPSTETGRNFYPHAYYAFLGLVARVFGVDPVAVWNVMGILVQLGLIVAIALVLIGISRRWWCGLLAPIPLLVGTFSWVWDPGSWYVTLASHAVLWGTFAVLFTLNGEAFALSAGAAMLLALIWLWLRPHSPKRLLWVSVLICLGIGSLANVQTYAFLTVVYVLVFVGAAWAVMTARNWWIAAISLVLLPVVYLVGPLVSAHAGQLPTLILGLAPAAPGVVSLAIRTRGKALLPLGALVIGAAPQVIWTVFGVVSRDPFLTYRVASNSQLGVPYVQGLLSGLVLVIPLLVVFAAGLVFRNPLWTAYGLGAGAAWFLLAFNDRWGANAEPYRLWIDGFAVMSIATLPMLVDVAVARSWMAAFRTHPEVEAAPAAHSWRNTATVMALVLCVGLAVASSIDWVRFFQNDGYHTSTDLRAAREAAVSRLAVSVAGDAAHGLTMTDPCIDPRILKINSGVPVAFYFIGMAWPAEQRSVQKLMDERDAGSLDFAAAKTANVRWLITDSRCAANWSSTYFSRLVRVRSSAYTTGDVSGRVTIWRIS